MIPEFNDDEVWPYDEESPYRVLPEGIYLCTNSELEVRFVFNFHDSETRHEIHEKFCGLLNEAQIHGFYLIHWLGGSFVSTKTNPEDVDVCTFVDNLQLSEPTASQQRFFDRITKGRSKIHDKYLTDQVVVVVFAPSHPMYEVYTETRDYWKEHYLYTREQRDISNPSDSVTRLPRAGRGIVSMHTGEPSASSSARFMEVNSYEDEANE